MISKVVLLAALASTLAILLLPTDAALTKKAGLQAVNLEASCATLDLGNPNSARYHNFLETIIDELSDGDCFGVPMLRPPLEIGGKEVPFPVIRKIRSSNGKTAVIVLNSNTLDLIGYADVDQSAGDKRFFKFQDSPEYDFPGHRVIHLPYKCALHDIASNAAIEINSTLISRPALDQLLNRIHGVSGDSENPEFGKEQAEFLVLVMRMIVGGLRFKYIQDTVSSCYEDGFVPDNKIMSIEHQWNDVSNKIAEANEKGQLPGYVLWPVSSVEAIKPDVGVVKYAENGVCAAQPYLRNWFPLARRYLKAEP